MEEIEINNLNENNSSRIYNNNTLKEVTPLTLDEPILTSLKRELFMISLRIKLIFSKKDYLNEDKKILYNYDLYLPIIIVILLSSISSIFGNNYSEISNIFSTIILTIFIGGILVTVNLRLFGSKISILQIFSYFGYSLFSYLVGDIINWILNIFIPNIILFFVDFIYIIISIIISYRLINMSIEEGKKKLALYPVILYNLILKLVILK